MSKFAGRNAIVMIWLGLQGPPKPHLGKTGPFGLLRCTYDNKVDQRAWISIEYTHPEEVLGQVSKNFGSTWAYMGFSPSGLVSKGRKAPKHSKAKTPSQNCLILFVIDIMSRDLSKRDNIGRVFLNFLFSQWLGEKAPKLLAGCLGHFFTNFQWGTYKHTPYWTQKPFLQHLTTPGFFSQLANFTGRKAAKKDNRPQSQFRHLFQNPVDPSFVGGFNFSRKKIGPGEVVPASLNVTQHP